MKNYGKICFIIICLCLCIFPFAGMIFYTSNTTTENRKLTEFPALIEKGKLNENFMKEAGNYFNDHFSCRQEFVSLDAEIQSKIFKVSNADSVVVGNNGWLYYSATVDDYLGRNIMSKRNSVNIAHNISLVQQYVEAKGAKFLFTIAPNKNSLYGENMPYYFQKKVNNSRNINILEMELKKYNILYADLFNMFKAQEEVLYLKKDSHWNTKGAMLAYNFILDKLCIKHKNYNINNTVYLKNEYGDLNKMLYPVTAEPEWNYYQKDCIFSYETDTKNVEDAWIVTENKKGKGSILMFRDSFGNTLLPLAADTFSKGYFSKTVPQNISEYMETYNPDVVIIEKVERNVQEFTKEPPVMEGVPIELKKKVSKKESNTLIEISKSKNNNNFLEISGVLDDEFCKEDVQIYIGIKDGSGINIYKAFYMSDESSDYYYKLYFPREKIIGNASCKVIIEKDEKLFEVKSKDIPKKLLGKRNKEAEIISKEKVYDCDGSGHGYYIIKWSDGKEEYKDF